MLPFPVFIHSSHKSYRFLFLPHSHLPTSVINQLKSKTTQKFAVQSALWLSVTILVVMIRVSQFVRNSQISWLNRAIESLNRSNVPVFAFVTAQYKSNFSVKDGSSPTLPQVGSTRQSSWRESPDISVLHPQVVLLRWENLWMVEPDHLPVWTTSF